jgi:hypothetical protein
MLNEFIATHGEKFDPNLSVREKYKSQESKKRSDDATKEYIRDSARGFVTAFIDAQKKLALGGRSVDIAAWDLEKVKPIAESVNLLGKALNKRLDLTGKIHADKLSDADILIYQELKKILHQAHYESQTYMSEQCVDLKDFCERLIFECQFPAKRKEDSVFTGIISECAKIIGAIDACVLKSGYCGDSYQFSNGISIYFPWSGLTYALTDFRYRYLRFNRGSTFNLGKPTGVGKEWRNFLHTYALRVTMRAARKNAGDDAAAPSTDYGTEKSILSPAHPIWSKENPTWSIDKDDPLWARFKPSGDNGNGDESGQHKDNPATGCKGDCRGEIGEYLIYFSRFKNYEMAWDISGFSDDKQ